MFPNTGRCTFCDLVQGAAEVSVCHEDADSIAFMDIQPVNTGHVLVIPRAHYNSLLDVPAELGMHLFRVTMRLAGAIRRVTGCSDLNIVVNSGAAAGQDEPHYHVHIIPRRNGDGFAIDLPFGGSQMPDRTLLDAMAVQLLAALRDPMKWESEGPRGDAPTKKQGRADTGSAKVLGANPVEIPAEETATKAANTVDLLGIDPPPNRPSFTERQVVVKIARDGSSSGDPSLLEVRQVQEGAHGELVYDERGTDAL